MHFHFLVVERASACVVITRYKSARCGSAEAIARYTSRPRTEIRHAEPLRPRCQFCRLDLPKVHFFFFFCCGLKRYLETHAEEPNKVLLVAGDVYRPAAIDQLITLGNKIEASGRDEILPKGQAEAATRESITAGGVSSFLRE